METMLGVLLVLLVLAVPLAALVLAILATVRLRRLEDRLRWLETGLAELRRGPADEAAPAAPPARPTEKRAAPAEERVAAPPPAAEPAAPAAATAPGAAVEAELPPPPRPPRSPAAARRPRLSLRDVEKSLGAKLPVWLGAVALVLAAAFLVKLSFDRGWLGPAVRVALGVVFGVALLGAGQWLHRSSAQVAQGLSAAGIATLFVALYAGVNLYGLIGPAAGFALMALTTAVAVGLSLRQGQLVAVLGLVGGFATPQLVHTDSPDAKVLFLYLLLLQLGLLAVGRRRGWWALTGAAFAGGLAWLGLWLAGPFRQTDAFWLGLFVVVSAALFAVVPVTGPDRPRQLGWLAGAGGFAGLALLTVRADYGPAEWGFLALLGSGALVLGRLEPRYQLLAWVGAAVPALLLAYWGLELEPAEAERFLWVVLLLGALHAGGAYLALWGSSQPARWGWLSAAAGTGALLLATLGAKTAGRELPWGAICLALALLYLAAALPVARRRGVAAGWESALAALATAVTAFVSLALPLELDNQWLTVGWSLEVTALVWLAGLLRVAILRRLAWLLAAAVAFRLLLNPLVLEYPIGLHPVFNWLLYGYGVPVAAFATAAWLAHRQSRSRLSEALQLGAMALTAMLATLLVRQGFHPGEPGAGGASLIEIGTLTVAWLALGWALLEAAGRWPLRTARWAGAALAWLALLAVLDLAFTSNPALAHEAVGGTPVWNWLLWIYGVPAALLALVARAARRRGLPLLPAAGRLATLALVFLLVTLETRQAFRGAYLDRGAASLAEQYAYSAAWILLGLTLLAGGIAGRGRLLRFASLAVMLLAVGKVFLWDLAELEDLYRVLSFLGLGLSLLLIAWLYQRFVFRDEPAADGEPQA